MKLLVARGRDSPAEGTPEKGGAHLRAGGVQGRSPAQYHDCPFFNFNSIYTGPLSSSLPLFYLFKFFVGV
jgi:hypothetical protein